MRIEGSSGAAGAAVVGAGAAVDGAAAVGGADLESTASPFEQKRRSLIRVLSPPWLPPGRNEWVFVAINGWLERGWCRQVFERGGAVAG